MGFNGVCVSVFLAEILVLQGQVTSIDIKLPRRSLLVEFSCNSCGERTKRLINRLAYERGLVFVQVTLCWLDSVSYCMINLRTPHVCFIVQERCKVFFMRDIKDSLWFVDSLLVIDFFFLLSFGSVQDVFGITNWLTILASLLSTTSVKPPRIWIPIKFDKLHRMLNHILFRFLYQKYSFTHD